MKKNNLAIIGASIITSSLLAAKKIEDVECINDIPTTEPFYLTNPYKVLIPLSFDEYSNKHNRKQNNRKNVKRKKAKNGKR